MSLSFFLSKHHSLNIPVICVAAEAYEAWLSDQKDSVQARLKNANFAAKAGSCEIIYREDGQIDFIIAGVSSPLALYDVSGVVAFIQTALAAPIVSKASFTLVGLNDGDLDKAFLGWALGCYRYDEYRDFDTGLPQLVWNKAVNQKRVEAFAEAIFKLRNLVNRPANDLGPADLHEIAEIFATHHKASFKAVTGAKLEKEFPLVQMVGQGAANGREPRLVEFSWGKKTHPKLTLVGKGVCFDTGGLNLKTAAGIRYMKKDMGGAAHALGLAHLIMTLNLPVQLRVIIPIVENSVSGAAFRPGDVVRSRSGRTVENVDTDAEGRLILADALTYAAEDKPDLIIDFATLTGSARTALGQDIPACFTNDPVLEPLLREVTLAAEDALWPMPLHQNYRDLLKSDVADTTNHVGMPGDLIYSALFLEGFLGQDAPRWIHVDCFAFETQGRPGRPKGGKDTGLRGMFAVLEQLYGG
jgi:leucyl aminopeptidase